MRIVVYIILFFCFSCGLKKERIESDKEDSIAASEIISSSEKITISQFTSNQGKYPMHTDMFKQEPLKSRLKLVLGMEWDDFMENWNTETPIEKEHVVFHTSGCKAHDCALNKYELFYDSEANIINVYKIKNGKMKVFKEMNKEITLPKGFAYDLKVNRQNANLEVLPQRL